MNVELFETDDELQQFWQWINLARSDESAYCDLLRRLDSQTLLRFDWTFREFADQLYDALEDIDFAPLTVNGQGASDDLVESVIGWLVTRGREKFERWLADPESIPEFHDYPRGVGIDVQYLAEDEYRKRHGEEMPRP